MSEIALPPHDDPAGLSAADTAAWQHRTLMMFAHTPRAAGLTLEPLRDRAALLPEIAVKLEKTPPEFAGLHSALERQMALGATAERAGAEASYVLGVTSAIAGEGKTTTALHLALTLARNTLKRVCLLDLSLGRDEIGARLGIAAAGNGLVGVLEGTSTVVPTLQITECDNLVVIPAGIASDNPARLARSPRVKDLIVAARATFDLVVVDLPAVSSENVLPLARHADGLLVVARAGVTPREVVAQAVETLGRARVIGVTLNRAEPSCPSWLQRRFGRH